MKIYLDEEYKCHLTNDGTMREIETSAFDGFCSEYIEGYRYIPVGEVWVSPAGIKCSGVSPWKDYSVLAAAQAAYEEGQAQGGGPEALIEAADVAYKEGVNSAYD